jgi:hypothetical protein
MTVVDDELEAELRRAADRFDPVPAHFRSFALDAFGLRTLEAELAELVYDSLVADDSGHVRGGEQPRLLTFETGELRIEVEVIGPDSRRRLVGQLLPPTPARIEIRGTGSTTTTDADDLGRFAADVPGPGPASLRITISDSGTGAGPVTVVTDWLSL